MSQADKDDGACHRTESRKYRRAAALVRARRRGSGVAELKRGHYSSAVCRSPLKILATLLVVLIVLFLVARPRPKPTLLTQHPWTLIAPQGVRQAEFEAGRERRASLLFGGAGKL